MGWFKLSAMGVAVSLALGPFTGCTTRSSPGTPPRSQERTPPKNLPSTSTPKQTTGGSKDELIELASGMSVGAAHAFRKLFNGPGTFLVHEEELFVQTEEFFFNATKGELITRCSFATGYWQSGRWLYFLARMSRYSACSDDPILMKYEHGNLLPWRRINAHAVSITSYRHGDIALVVPHRAGPPWGYELVALENGISPPRPRRVPPPPDESGNCYTELQDPFSSFGFDSGHLFVFGSFLCPLSEDENQPDDERQDDEADVEVEDSPEAASEAVSVEYWTPGISTSKLVSFGFNEAIAVTAPRADSVWILGRDTTDAARATQHLFHFDGHSWSEAPLESKKEVLSIATAPSDEGADLWFLKRDRLVRAHDRKSLRLPEECKTPLGFHIHSQAVWLSCEEGVFSSDARVEIPLTLTEDASCSLLDARPERQIASLWGKGASGGCGTRSREFEREFLLPSGVPGSDF